MSQQKPVSQPATDLSLTMRRAQQRSAHSPASATASKAQSACRTSPTSRSSSDPTHLHTPVSDRRCQCTRHLAREKDQAQTPRSRPAVPATYHGSDFAPHHPQHCSHRSHSSHIFPVQPVPTSWAPLQPTQVFPAAHMLPAAYPGVQAAVQEYYPPAQAYGLPYSHTPAAPLHDFGLGPEPLFGWESVIPLVHTYGQPKHWRFTKPDYRRFCYSVGKADVPIARKWAGPLGPMLVPAVTGWGG